MEQHLNLWDIEKIARQYLGFNDQVVNEYHKNFKGHNNGRIYSNGGYLILQWRTTYRVKDLGFKYIYTFRNAFHSSYNGWSPEISQPPILFEDNVYRASSIERINTARSF